MRKQIKKTTITAVLLFVGLMAYANTGDDTSKPEPLPIESTVIVLEPVETTTITVPVTTTSTTTTTEVPLMSDPADYIDEQRMLHGRCGEWHDLALSVGWQESEWATLSNVIYRESRCTPDACSKSTSGLKCRDAGLTQINQIHTSWLLDMGWTHPEDMFNPTNNLLFALRLWETSGWKPWKATSGT
jgi:hypothetical protein